MSSSSTCHPFRGMEPAGKSQRPCASPKLYDVFINHRGPDVKMSLAIQLYNTLEKMGCRAFLDYQEIEEGDYIPSTIENAILSSTVQIAIFSKRYAESAWCLAELCLMLKTKAKLIPVFYDVTPTELRHIETGQYFPAFAENKEKGRYLDKLDEWKEALHLVSFISGYDFSKDDHQNNEKLCKDIVFTVLKEVERTRSLDVAKNPVGLNELVEDFERRCLMESEQKVGMVGIFGIGGMGKTTLARELFNRKHLQYHGSCFLFDVREAALKIELPHLQSKLLQDLLKEKRKFQSTDEGRSYLGHRLKKGQFMRFLVVVDDIDHPNQLDSLLDIDSLTSGSLVMVTTRDERVLIQKGITHRYKIPKMDMKHSKELFCLHAFHLQSPARGYEDLVENFVKECGGLPLTLQVLGGHLYGSNDKDYWQLELDKVRTMLPGGVKCRFKISFDALDSEQKQIFMDIACFFVGKSKDMAMEIWKGSGWSGEHALQTLKDRCLVEVERRDGDQIFHYQDYLVLKMHDNLRDLGREMADELNAPCRIWRPRDLQSLALKGFRNILTEADGRSFRCLNSTIDMDIGAHVRCFLGNSKNYSQTSTNLLWLELIMMHGHLKCIPLWIPLQNLECLSIIQEPYNLNQLWKSIAQAPVNLKKLELNGTYWRELPHNLGMLTRLEELNITRWCKETVEWKILSDLLSKLTNLRTLVLRYLKVSGDVVFGKSGVASPVSMIESIYIEGLKNSTKVSITGTHCPKLKFLYIGNMSNLSEMDLTGVTSLNSLLLEFCRKLKKIARNFELKNLVELRITECQEFEELPSLATLSCLNSITIDGCHKLHNLKDIEKLEGLKHLYLSASDRAAWNCIQTLQRIPSEFTTVIGRAGYAAGSIINANLFSEVIGVDAVSQIHKNENGDMEAFLKAPESLSDIIVCAVVQSPRRNLLHAYPLMNASDHIRSSLSNEEWILTIVLSTGGEINNVEQFIHYIDGFFDDDAEIKMGYIATIKKGEEWKTLHTFRSIVATLYQVI